MGCLAMVSLNDILSQVFENEALSTLRLLFDAHGRPYYTLSAISHDQPSEPQAVTPDDPYFDDQWHLFEPFGLHVQEVWEDYQGNGVTIGFVDDGMQYTHPDLAANYNTAIDFDVQTGTGDGMPRSTSDNHGTTTGGIAAGVGDNGIGVTGVAYGADLANFRLPFSVSLSDYDFASLYVRQLAAGVDVSNNSWGFGSFFQDNFDTTLPLMGAAIEDLAELGRGGLGANVVFSGGNGRTSGQNTNYHSIDNSQYVIAVAATDEGGEYTYFSTPGATLLTSAPGIRMASTDRTGSDGYIYGDYVTGLAGTSYSAPAVSGVVALMLEANPGLGYRDVQEILAYSSRNSDPGDADWQTNGAGNWNGGGLHFNHNYGFGLVDAYAAVRLAETWQSVSTYANRDMVDGGTDTASVSIPNNNTTGVSRTLTVTPEAELTIDRIELDIDIDHNRIGDVIVTLTSPSGMVSTLVNRPGYTGGFSGSSLDDIHFTLGSNAFWGEETAGDWVLTVKDVRSGYSGTLDGWSLRFYGDDASDDDTYIYTDEFADMKAADASRGLLMDGGGNDTINLAAIASASVLNLTPGSLSTVDGASLTIDSSSVIEHAYLGDGDDTVTGNDADNVIEGMRGADSIEGGDGNDTLEGGEGDDFLSGGDGDDFLSGFSGTNTMDGGAGGDTILGWAHRDSILGGDGNDSLYAGSADDTVYGGAGHDRIDGYNQDDLLFGEAGSDTIFGGNGDDTIDPGSWFDTVSGGAGADMFVFGQFYSAVGAGKRDVITDFSQAEGDMIDFTSYAPGAVFIGMNPFTAGVAEIHYFHDGGNTIVELDTINGFVNYQVELTGLIDLTAGDFV